jgi:hypothetical protein
LKEDSVKTFLYGCTLVALGLAVPTLAPAEPSVAGDAAVIAVPPVIEPLEEAPRCASDAATTEEAGEAPPARWGYGWCYSDCSRCETYWDCPFMEACTSIPLC